MEVIITRGLPASGKSTWAKEKISENPGTWKRINLDDLRAMFDNSYQSKGNEKFVKKMRDVLFTQALKEGKNIISDNTHLSPRSVEHIKQLVEKFNSENFPDKNDYIKVSEKWFLAPLEECIKRDLKRPCSVGAKVITDMYNQFLAPTVEPLVQNKFLERAIIVDIDGTVAEKGNRSPFDWANVGKDTPKIPVIMVVQLLFSRGYKIIFLSGRDSVCKELTHKWLIEHIPSIEFDLYMREENDMRNDAIIKKELFDKYIRDKYYVEFVLDDRDRVVSMWRKEIGLTCLQVAYGDF